MPPRYFIRKRLVTEPWEWSVPTATSNTPAGQTSNSDDSYRAKVKTQNSSGTHTSLTSGENVTLTIQYQAADGTSQTKFIKVNESEASEFINELNEGAPFPTLWSKNQSFIFPADKIFEIRIEEEDVPEVSESQGEEATDVGSRKASWNI